MEKDFAYFKKELAELGLELTDIQLEQFDQYYELLVETNKLMNLTAITEYEEVILKHFIDSLAIVNVVDITQYNTIIDVGTGAGFPGIPLKIVYPHLKLTLLDSLNKRIKFLQDVCGKLGLKDVTFVHGRSEDIGQDKNYREKYDICVSRAVANISTLSEYCLPFVKIDGDFISYKAGGSTKEVKEGMNAIKKLSGELNDIHEFVLPNSDISRSFVFIKKIAKMNRMYPRKAGIPAKEPIK